MYETAGVLKVRGVWSHLANGELIGDPSVAGQISLFRSACALACEAGLAPSLRHLGNSAAALQTPEAHFDLVRAGIALRS